MSFDVILRNDFFVADAPRLDGVLITDEKHQLLYPQSREGQKPNEG